MKNKLYLSLVIVGFLCLIGWTGFGQEQRSSVGSRLGSTALWMPTMIVPKLKTCLIGTVLRVGSW